MLNPIGTIVLLKTGSKYKDRLTWTRFVGYDDGVTANVAPSWLVRVHDLRQSALTVSPGALFTLDGLDLYDGSTANKFDTKLIQDYLAKQAAIIGKLVPNV